MSDTESVFRCLRERMQHDGAMRIDHTFRTAGRARSKTHCGGIIFVNGGIRKISTSRCEQRFVIFTARRHGISAVRNDEDALEVCFAAKTFQERKKYIIHDKKPVVRITGDECEFGRMQKKI